MVSTTGILRAYIKKVFPMVDEELGRWKREASKCPDSLLSSQALSSIDKKSFHAVGGSVYALYPGVDMQPLVSLIVAYQTISDYLDNLCDRAGVLDEEAFSCLHLSMVDALADNGAIHDYYGHYPCHEDGGYLESLVNECNFRISTIPSYELVRDTVKNLAKLYSNLQVYKHLPLNIREEKLFHWADIHTQGYPAIVPFEFCAAAGSTLGIFILFSAACDPNITRSEIKKIREAYFPWVCGLHILLDYFIDYNEDIENNDLNFVRYYRNDEETLKRLSFFIDTSLRKVSSLKYPTFHKTVVRGLLAMYLSDPKAYQDNLRPITRSIIARSGMKLKLMHNLCLRLRSEHVLS